MSRDRGLRLQNALAAYLRQWWPSAESAGAGRPDSDVLGTPGIVWENKTSGKGGRNIGAWIEQAEGHARGNRSVTHVVVYWPPGIGERRPELAVAMLPLGDLTALLAQLEYLDDNYGDAT
jgi:hypothetical protein